MSAYAANSSPVTNSPHCSRITTPPSMSQHLYIKYLRARSIPRRSAHLMGSSTGELAGSFLQASPATSGIYVCRSSLSPPTAPLWRPAHAVMVSLLPFTLRKHLCFQLSFIPMPAPNANYRPLTTLPFSIFITSPPVRPRCLSERYFRAKNVARWLPNSTGSSSGTMPSPPRSLPLTSPPCD